MATKIMEVGFHYGVALGGVIAPLRKLPTTAATFWSVRAPSWLSWVYSLKHEIGTYYSADNRSDLGE